MFDFCDEGSGEEEGAEKREENGPRVIGVCYGSEGSCDDANWGERVARVGAVDEDKGRWDGDIGFHGGLDGEEDGRYLLSILELCGVDC